MQKATVYAFIKIDFYSKLNKLTDIGVCVSFSLKNKAVSLQKKQILIFYFMIL